MVMPLVKYFWNSRNTMMMGTDARAAPAIRIPKSVELSPCSVAIPTEMVRLVEEGGQAERLLLYVTSTSALFFFIF